MPEIVIPDLSHSLCLEQFRKTLCDVVGLDQIANLIDTYILRIFLDVAASAQAAVFLLFFFQRKKSFPHERNKRQCPHTRFGLCGVRRNQNALAVKITGSNRMTDGRKMMIEQNHNKQKGAAIGRSFLIVCLPDCENLDNISSAASTTFFRRRLYADTNTFIASARPVDADETGTSGTDKSVPYKGAAQNSATY